MSTKRVSSEEKSKRLYSHFEKHPEPFVLKEMEKIGPKMYGIVEKTVKDTLESLVSEQLIQAEKIGTSTYFFLFKSAETKRLKALCESMEEEAKVLEAKVKELEELQHEREGEENYDDLLRELEESVALEKELSVKLDSSQVMTVAQSKDLQARTTQLEQGSNRWTENIMMLQSWCRDKFMLSEQDFCNSFQIPQDLDVEF